jgi:hypothetical protein
MEPVYVTGKTKVITIKRSFGRDVIKMGNSYFISIPIDVIRDFHIQKGDLLMGDFDCFIPLLRTKV